MNEEFFRELSAWLTEAGLAGTGSMFLCLNSVTDVSPLEFHSLGV